MFKIDIEPIGKYENYFLRNVSTGEFVSVIPQFGATLNQIALKKGNLVYELLNGCSNYEELISEGKNKFKGSKLYPFPNRIKDGQYSFENKIYNLPINFPNENNAIHGLVLESSFDVIDKSITNDFVSLTIQYNTNGSEVGYTFKSKLIIEYKLSVQNGFSCTTTIENYDNINIPIGDGWHPYFKTGTKMDECILQLPVSNSYEVDSRMIPTGKTIEETKFNIPTIIGSSNFDTGYKLVDSKNDILFTYLECPSKNIKISFWQEAGEGQYKYLQIYIPPDRQSIAIEPMTCLANGFNNKIGLLSLKPKEKRNFSFGLKLE